jgi:hypothetical protein
MSGTSSLRPAGSAPRRRFVKRKSGPDDETNTPAGLLANRPIAAATLPTGAQPVMALTRARRSTGQQLRVQTHETMPHRRSGPRRRPAPPARPRSAREAAAGQVGHHSLIGSSSMAPTRPSPPPTTTTACGVNIHVRLTTAKPTAPTWSSQTPARRASPALVAMMIPGPMATKPARTARRPSAAPEATSSMLVASAPMPRAAWSTRQWPISARERRPCTSRPADWADDPGSRARSRFDRVVRSRPRCARVGRGPTDELDDRACVGRADRRVDALVFGDGRPRDSRSHSEDGCPRGRRQEDARRPGRARTVRRMTRGERWLRNSSRQRRDPSSSAPVPVAEDPWKRRKSLHRIGRVGRAHGTGTHRRHRQRRRRERGPQISSVEQSHPVSPHPPGLRWPWA